MTDDEGEAFELELPLTPEQEENLREAMRMLAAQVAPAVQRQQEALQQIAAQLLPTQEMYRKAVMQLALQMKPQLEAMQNALRPQIAAMAVMHADLGSLSAEIAVRPVETSVTIPTPSIAVRSTDGKSTIDIPATMAVSLCALVNGALAMALRVPGASDEVWVQELMLLNAFLLQWAFQEFDRVRRGG